MRRTNSTSSGSHPSGFTPGWISSHGTSLSEFSMLNHTNSWRHREVDAAHDPPPSNARTNDLDEVYPYNNLSVSIIAGHTPLCTPFVSPERTTRSPASRSIRSQSSRQGNVSSTEISHDSYRRTSIINTDKDLPTPPLDVAPGARVNDEEEYYELTISGGTPFIIRVHYKKRTAIIFLPKDYKGLNYITKKVFRLPETFDLLFSTKTEEFGRRSAEIDTEVWTTIKNRITQVWAREHPDSLVEVTLIRWGASNPAFVKSRLSRWTTGADLMARYPGRFLYRYIEEAKMWKLYQNNDKLMDYCVNQAATIWHSAKEIPPNNVLAKRTSESGSTYSSVRQSIHSSVNKIFVYNTSLDSR